MFIAPMLLEKRETPFNDSRYLYEPKIDGHRLIVSTQGGAVRLYTRHMTDVTLRYPELRAVPIDDASDAVLDSEVAVVEPETGAIFFEDIMERFLMQKEEKISKAAKTMPVQCFVFDILRYKGQDLRSRTLKERKELLQKVLGKSPNYSQVLSLPGEGEALFQAIVDRDLEGIVAKRIDSPYVGRRDPRWLKIINYTYADVAISGYRLGEFGWLVHYNGRPAGMIELAVPATHKQAFYGVAKKLVIGQDRSFVYLEPKIMARVRFRNWTRAGKIRSPEFVSFVI